MRTVDGSILDVFRKYGFDCAWKVGTPINEDIEFEAPVRVLSTKFIGKCKINAFTYFVDGTVNYSEVGRYCSIAKDVIIGPGSHPLEWLSTHPFQFLNDFRFNVGDEFNCSDFYKNHRMEKLDKRSTVIKVTAIGNDVWIGNGALVLPGIKVGDGAIIAAKIVVTKDVPDYSIVAGNPARVIRYRFDDSIINLLLDLKWWNYAPWQLNGLKFYDVEDAISNLRLRVDEGMLPYTPSVYTVKDIFI